MLLPPPHPLRHKAMFNSLHAGYFYALFYVPYADFFSSKLTFLSYFKIIPTNFLA